MERNRAIGIRCRRTAGFDVAERVPDLLLELLRRHVADADDGHAIGPVPGVVERPQPGGRRRANDLGLADRQSFRIPRLVEEDRKLLVANPRARAKSAAPFLDDDAALLVDFLRGEREAAREICERGQPSLHDLRFVRR